MLEAGRHKLEKSLRDEADGALFQANQARSPSKVLQTSWQGNDLEAVGRGAHREKFGPQTSANVVHTPDILQDGTTQQPRPRSVRNFSRPLRSASVASSFVNQPLNNSSHLSSRPMPIDMSRSAPSSPATVYAESIPMSLSRSLSNTHLADERPGIGRKASVASNFSVASSIIPPESVSSPFAYASRPSEEKEHLHPDDQRWRSFFSSRPGDEDVCSISSDLTSDQGHAAAPAITFSPPLSRNLVSERSRLPSQLSIKPTLKSQPGSDDRPPSLYSHYSYYEMPETPLHSNTPAHDQQESKHITYADGGPSNTFLKTKRSINLLNVPQDGKSKGKPLLDSDDPSDCCLIGIDLHEKGQLDRAAYHFEKAAKAGNGAGMLLFGLCLRHGWGTAVNAERGFQWIQKTAERASGDLDSLLKRGTLTAEEKRAMTDELVLAIYELGISFRFGFGVKKDKKLAISYFELAANLGDADAMQELGFCCLNGKGCKKDTKKSAHWYRAASKAGRKEPFGSSWIWKTKYDDESNG